MECFSRAATTGSFSAAARQLALTPSAVSRNIAMLERNLGVRLFQRTTRKLTLTEAGDRLADSIRANLDGLLAALADVSSDTHEPAGVLKVSMATVFGAEYLVPLLPDFLARYPQIRVDWHLDNRHVDLVAEGFDVAIGRGSELSPGVVSRTLARVQVVALASPTYLAGRALPDDPSELADHDLIDMRSTRSGRLVRWTLSHISGAEMAAPTGERMAFNDPGALCSAAALGLGVALVAVPHALRYLKSGELVRLLPDWSADAGPISIYYANRSLLPAKVRVFVDHVVETFERQKLAEQFVVGSR